MSEKAKINRREFGAALGVGAGAAAAASTVAAAAAQGKTPGLVKVAFAYPPSKKLAEEGYYSWPGSGFDAEGRQAQYTLRLEGMAREMNLRLEVEQQPLDTPAQVEGFIASARQARPAGLLLIPFKKSHYDQVTKVLDAAVAPAVVFATMGILLNGQIQKLHRAPGVYLINSLENLDAVRSGLKMLSAAHRLRETRLVNINGTQREEKLVSHLGTRVIQVPHAEFYGRFARIGITPEVKDLARTFLQTAVKRVEPTEEDVYEAAKTYFVLKQIARQESADALMMNCLPGLRQPHRHVPPCMGFMKLRDEGLPVGCESDLDATLTMTIIQYLFDKPGFQHNPSMDTEKNRYFGAHCTAPTKMNGIGGSAEPYILRNHAEAGWGCVPQVLFPEGQKATFGKLLTAGAAGPRMLIYGGTITGCPPSPPCGGCRTNFEMELDELKDATEVKGHHLCLFYGQHARELDTFCRLMRIQRA